MSHLLDPKNDFVFKRLFAGAPHLLADLINAVRHGEAPVEVVEVLNPRIEPADLTGKFIVLDVLARDAAGRLFNVEMQVRRHADWPLRSAYYLARTLANQLQGGEDYAELKPVIGIHLMDFELFEQDQAYWCFELRDRHPSAVVLTQSLQLHLIELPKADRLREATAPDPVSTVLRVSLSEPLQPLPAQVVAENPEGGYRIDQAQWQAGTSFAFGRDYTTQTTTTVSLHTRIASTRPQRLALRLSGAHADERHRYRIRVGEHIVEARGDALASTVLGPFDVPASPALPLEIRLQAPAYPAQDLALAFDAIELRPVDATSP